MVSFNSGWKPMVDEPDLGALDPGQRRFPTEEARLDYGNAYVELYQAARDAGVASIRIHSSGQPAPADLRAFAASLHLHS